MGLSEKLSKCHTVTLSHRDARYFAFLARKKLYRLHRLNFQLPYTIITSWKKVFMPIPKPNFWQDAVKLLMSPSDEGQFEKRYKITILAITFLFSNRGKFLDMFWNLHDICDVFKAKTECQGSNYGCNVEAYVEDMWRQSMSCLWRLPTDSRSVFLSSLASIQACGGWEGRGREEGGRGRFFLPNKPTFL